ncbi:MAG: protein kinase [Planctomycetes bacterium]|nr:protein kinase [Planctomycetota bacterium]
MTDSTLENEVWLQRLREAGPVPQSRGGDLAGGPLPADLIPGYELLAEIGRGGQGIVFSALQVQTSRIVALKLLHDGPLASASAERRFQREIELSSALNHAGVLTIFDAGVAQDGRRFVVSRLLKGQPLDQWLEIEQPVLEQRLDVILQLCRALEHAHQRGVIHLDLKPSNVMVGASGKVCILDFGLARLLEHSANHSLSNGMIAGTPAYMAPEQVNQNPANWDTRTDLYALGVLLFEVITGRAPFSGDGTPLEVLKAVETTLPPSLQTLVQNQIPRQRVRDLDAICTKAMAKEPDLRYSSASAFALDLQAMMSGEQVMARGMDRSYRLRIALKRNRPAIAIILASLLFTTWFAYSARVQKTLRADAILSRDQARQAAIAFLHEVDPLIKTLPGAAPARQRIVLRGLEFLVQLQDQVGDDPQLAIHLATGYFLIGNIQADLYSSSFGLLEDSLQSYQNGLQLLDALQSADVKQQQEILRVRFDLLRKRGQILRGLARWEQVGAGVQLELKVAEQLVELNSADVRHQRYLALALEDMGWWVEHEGRLKESLDFQLRSQAILEELLTNHPNETGLQRDLAVGMFKIGQSLRALGRIDEAQHRFLQFLDAAASGDDMTSQTDRSTAHEWVSRLEFQRGNHDVALIHSAAAITILETLVATHSDNLNLRTSLATNLNHAGEVYLADEDFEYAHSAFHRFRQVAAALVVDFPQVARNHRLLAVSFYKEFEWHTAQGAKQPAQSTERGTSASLAKAALAECLAIFQFMQEQSLLSPDDSGVIESLESELSALDN